MRIWRRRRSQLILWSIPQYIYVFALQPEYEFFKNRFPIHSCFEVAVATTERKLDLTSWALWVGKWSNLCFLRVNRSCVVLCNQRRWIIDRIKRSAKCYLLMLRNHPLCYLSLLFSIMSLLIFFIVHYHYPRLPYIFIYICFLFSPTRRQVPWRQGSHERRTQWENTILLLYVQALEIVRYMVATQ